MRALAVLLTVSACSFKPSTAVETGDGPQGDGPSDGPDVDAPPDSFMGAPPTACVAKWLAATPTFSNPVFVDQAGENSINGLFDERDPFVSSDQRQIYFSRFSGSTLEIITGSRAQPGDAFSAVGVKGSLSDASSDDSKVSMTGDDLTAFIATTRANGEGGSDIWEVTRSMAGTSAFTEIGQAHLGAVNDGGSQLDPHISPDGLRLYFAANVPQQIVISTRTTVDDNFGAPQVVGQIGSAVGDADPTLTADERVIIFTSNRPGAGGTDLWYATRAERDQPFGEVKALPFNTVDQDADAHVTADGCSIYFASTRDPGTADYDLYVTDLQ